MPDTNSQPAVTVLLAARNGMLHLPEAIDSIRNQTFEDFDLLVVDNGSTDGSADFVKSLSDTRIQYVYHGPPGLAGALNYGLQHVRGELVARMDADDVSLPFRLEKQVEFMRNHLEHVLLGSAFDMIDEDGQVTGPAMNVVHDEVIRWAMLFFNPFLHSGVMFRRDAVVCCGGYDEDFEVAQDFDLWRRLSAKGNMHNIGEVLSHKRFTQASTTGQSSKTQLSYAARTVGEYAAAYAPEIDLDQLVALRNWYIDGYCPPLRTASKLPECFTQCVRLLAGINDPDAIAEASELEMHLRAMMRYRSHYAARRVLSKPWSAATFLGIGQAFDPDAGSLAGRAWQWARRKMLGGKCR
jgi:GT2 family glycosyltransferase